MIRRQEWVSTRRNPCNFTDCIRGVFNRPAFDLVPFAAGPYDVADDSGEGKPYLALVNYDAASVSPDALSIPELIEKTWLHKGAGGDWRHNRKNLVFVVADAGSVKTMREKMTRRLALDALRAPDKQKDLAEYQIAKLGEFFERSAQELALAVQQTYRHIFYPSRNKVEGANADLAHTAVDVQTASDRPGDGQKQIVTQLQNVGKLRLSGDQPDAPAYVRDRTPLKRGQITTAQLRNEFRTDVSLPILVGDDVFLRGLRVGIDQGEYIYKHGDLLMGKGDPFAEIHIDEQSLIFTSAYAREHGFWPRPVVKPEAATPASPATAAEITYPTSTMPLTTTTRAEDPAGMSAEDGLRAALTQVFEKAQRAKVSAIGRLLIRPFDAQDALQLLNGVNAIANADKRVELSIEFESADGSTIEIQFRGSAAEALPLKDAVAPLLRAARDRSISCQVEIRFDPAFTLLGDAPQKFIERIARFASGSAEVIAFRAN